MLQPAPRASLPVRTSSVDGAIDHLLGATAARLDRVVVAAALPAPTVRDPELAVRTLEPLLETLAGLALGQLIGVVAAGIRRTLGLAMHAHACAAIATASAALVPPLAAPLFAVDEAPCRCFGAELRHRLRRRISLAPTDARPVLAAIAGAIAAHDPAELPAFTRLLGVLADDPVLSDRYGHDLAEGWRCYAAIVERKPVVAGSMLWTRWTRRVRGERAQAALTQAEVVAAGFIAQIG